MRRLLLLVALCLVGVLVISSAAFAQDYSSASASAMGSASAMMGSASASAMGSASAMMGSASASAMGSASATASASALPGTGGPIGPSLLGLMAGAMLLGSGVVSLAIVRRRI
jgi:hypothetical protein